MICRVIWRFSRVVEKLLVRGIHRSVKSRRALFPRSIVVLRCSPLPLRQARAARWHFGQVTVRQRRGSHAPAAVFAHAGTD